MPAPPDAAVEVTGLMEKYAETTAVDHLTFVAARGRVTALLGPNGAGKTTTVETCEGFRRPDAGTVRVLGLDPYRDGRELRPRVGVMPQSGGAYPGARAAEMLRLVASFAAHPLDTDALLDRLGLTAAARTPYRRLSGGQQQRLSLAMAIVGRPELVFLDEPTAGLDPQARRATWDLVQELRADGVTVLLTTHYMEEAERLADTVLIVDHGRLVASGTPAELTGAADGGLRFRADRPVDEAALLAALPSGTSVARAEGNALVVRPPHGRVTPELVAAVTSECARQGVLASDVSVGHGSLEDVFLELTGRELRS